MLIECIEHNKILGAASAEKYVTRNFGSVIGIGFLRNLVFGMPIGAGS